MPTLALALMLFCGQLHQAVALAMPAAARSGSGSGELAVRWADVTPMFHIHTYDDDNDDNDDGECTFYSVFEGHSDDDDDDDGYNLDSDFKEFGIKGWADLEPATDKRSECVCKGRTCACRREEEEKEEDKRAALEAVIKAERVFYGFRAEH